MFSCIHSGALVGLEALLISVETDVYSRGLPGITMVGLPSKAVEQAKERVLAALKNSELPIPQHRVTINLSPADIPKEGTLYDVPIAIGLLASTEYIRATHLENSLFVGELSLNGDVMSIRGALPLTLRAKQKGYSTIFLPRANSAEVSFIEGITVYPVTSLQELTLHLNGHSLISPLTPTPIKNTELNESFQQDFADIIGQTEARRGAEIAAAGFHNIMFHGPPGTGKTLLARAMPSIVPPLSMDEIIETTNIFSISGLLTPNEPLIIHPPFRSPHHTTSRIGLIGGSSKPRPGEISLAHRGILFLDELAEFPRSVIEALRQPLEDGFVTISRASGHARFPTRFILVAATNPCPCGNLGNPKRSCSCTATQVNHYKKRLSGPLMDRIDLHVTVPFIEADKLHTKTLSEKSSIIRTRVAAARTRQQKRLTTDRIKTNGEMGTKEIKKYCQLNDNAQSLLKKAVDKLNLSARTYFKVIKVAQTIADLADRSQIEEEHIAEALQYRPSD